jgi:hypothetical protein
MSAWSLRIWTACTTVPLVVALEHYVVGVDVVTAIEAGGLPDIIPRQGDVVLCYRKWALSKLSKDQLATFTDPFTNDMDCGRIAGMPNEYVIVGGNPLSMTMHLVPPYRCLIAKGVEGHGTHQVVHLGMLKGVAAFILWPPSRVGPLPDMVGSREDLK